MAQYSRNIDQLPALNDPYAEVSLEHWGGHAPAVAAGQPRDLNDVAQASKECHDLQWLRRNKANVTNFEIASAELRKTQILVEHGEGPVTMNAFQEMFANFRDQMTQVQTQQTEQNQQMAQVQAQLTEQNQQMAEVKQLLEPIPARLDNIDVKRFNLQAINSAKQDRLTDHLRPMYKIHEGYGRGLPDHEVPGFPPARVGDPVPNDLFPATVGRMEALTHKKLSEISAWLNDTFGIVAQDSIEERRNKFRYHIS